MKFAIVVFPGSNCEQDCFHVTRNLLGCETKPRPSALIACSTPARN